jgi:hypothetical protein
MQNLRRRKLYFNIEENLTDSAELATFDAIGLNIIIKRLHHP